MFIEPIQSHFEQVRSEIADGPILPNVTAEEIRKYLQSRYDFTRPLSLEAVLEDSEKMLRTWQVQVTHPRYFGLFNPSVTLASVVADALVAIYNPQLANWRTSPAANEIERHTLGWFANKFGLPESTIATFTSGGMEANFSAVVAALTSAFPAYGEYGLGHLPGVPTVYLTAEAHHGFNKIVHMAGLGRRALRFIATDRNLKMDIDDLQRKVAEDRQSGLVPFMIIGTAGTTAAGVIDPLPEIARFCREEQIWFHVDAAWGGSAVISEQLKPYLTGIDKADSITCDAHKWLSVPMGCGMFFCRHPNTVAEAFRADVSYMSGKKVGPVFDPFTNSAQWSRRFIGLKLFMALAEKGEEGYAQMLEHQVRMGEILREDLRLSGWKIVNSTPFPLVCFTREGLVPSRLIAALHERQIAWMSEARLGDTPVVRACVTSYATTEEDIHWVIEQMNLLVTPVEKYAVAGQEACL
jgi:glutamate/tyrosine decarboxylase-like PLP-dependent enzyme